MEKRQYMSTGKMISLLGFGCMRLPKIDPEKPDIDYERAQELIDYAYVNGVNYFDTAWPYHGKLSEPFVGHALSKYPRDSFHLASKMPGWDVKTLAEAEEVFEKQLERCKTEYFDFYLCHALGDENIKIYKEIDIYGMLEQKKAEGKIRHLGFSFHGKPELLKEIVAWKKWDFAQIQLNYLDWEMQDAKQQYEILEQNGIPCIIMEPVRGGALATLCADAAAVFKEARPHSSVASWAIRYAASLPNVMTVLSGMSNMEQMVDNIATMAEFVPVTAGDMFVIERACNIYRASKTVPCTGCRYCMDCPSGVDIPLMFKLFNEYALNEDKDEFIEKYKAAGQAKHPTSCIGCKKCTENCPQDIDIPQALSDVAALAKKLIGE